MSLSNLHPVIKRTLSDEATDRLREAIKSGTLPPGQQLVERELAVSLGVSRIPVREAIHRLLKEGLVKKLAHGGTYVYSPSREEIEEISSLRVVLERFVAERCVARWSLKHEARLRRIVDEMERAAARSDLDKMCEQDALFHETLWRIAEHSILLDVVSGLRTRVSRFLREANSALTDSERANHIAAHHQLVESLKSGDVARAQQAMAEHVLIARDRIFRYYGPAMEAGHDPANKSARQRRRRGETA